MISTEIQHFSLNRILLLTIGLWPYNRSKFVLFQQILLFSILTSFVVFQVTIILTAKCTSSFVITMSSFILLYLACVIEYNSFWMNSQTVINLMEQLKNVCNELRDENEINVMKKYICNAKRYTTKIILVTVVSLPLAVFMTIWPRILDIIKPKNESRSDAIWMQIMTQHFVDKRKYYYLFLFHMNAALCIGVIAIVGTGTMFIEYFKYACGIFRIARLVKSLVSSFEGTLFFLISINVLNLSLNLCRIVSVGNDKEQFIIHFTATILTLLYMFITNYIGQEIMDHNNHIFFTAYNVCWYKAPVHIQKLILFVLQMGSKVFGLNIGGLFLASLNCFASLLSTSISYFTVIYSTQQ